jgi:hypothetical protein
MSNGIKDCKEFKHPSENYRPIPREQWEVSHASRETAIAAGVTRYIGRPCPKHPELDGERRVKSYKCVQCTRDSVQSSRSARWFREHPMPE